MVRHHSTQDNNLHCLSVVFTVTLETAAMAQSGWHKQGKKTISKRLTVNQTAALTTSSSGRTGLAKRVLSNNIFTLPRLCWFGGETFLKQWLSMFLVVNTALATQQLFLMWTWSRRNKHNAGELWWIWWGNVIPDNRECTLVKLDFYHEITKRQINRQSINVEEEVNV